MGWDMVYSIHCISFTLYKPNASKVHSIHTEAFLSPQWGNYGTFCNSSRAVVSHTQKPTWPEQKNKNILIQ